MTERKRVRVLVAGEAAAFLEDVEVPPDVEVDILAAGAPVPEGDYAGILPVLTRRIGASELDRLPALRVVANMAVGYDNVDVAAGREVGRRAGAFGMGVAYWGRNRRRDWERETGAEWIPSLPALAAHADVLSIHLASNAGTRGLVDGALLDRMKPGAMLVNTARGDVIDEAALVARLERGRIRAGLDVYANEPEVPARLRALDNVVLLPHLGSATRETRQAMFDLAWDNLLRCVRGDAPLTPVE
ncbi:MAG: NAD(P)-dependent oxidoreductase [Gemmatimonadota bacterium]